MTDADFANPTQESIWRVTRQLKKEQYSLYNCVSSVLSDAAFVSEVRALYPTTPLLANLRCGLWYTRQPNGTCYFKSTDGHNGNWSFSCTRLNWHVCELAAKQGGVIIVDATRKGKRFPDAMTKTIPIWAAVVNRAVARKRAEAAKRLTSFSTAPAATTSARSPSAPPSTTPTTSCGPKAASAATHYTTNNNNNNNNSGGGTCGLPAATCAQQQALSAALEPAPFAPVSEAAHQGGVARVDSLSHWLDCPFAAALADWEASEAGDAAVPGDAPGASSAPAPPAAPTDAVAAPVAPPRCGCEGVAAAAAACECGAQVSTSVEAEGPEGPQQPDWDLMEAVLGSQDSQPQQGPSQRLVDEVAGDTELEGCGPVAASEPTGDEDALDGTAEGARVEPDEDGEGVDLAAASASHVSCSPEESCGRRGLCCALGGDVRGHCSGGGGEGFYEMCDMDEGLHEAVVMPVWPPRCGMSQLGTTTTTCRCHAGHHHQQQQRQQQEGAEEVELRGWEQRCNAGGCSAFSKAAAAAIASSNSSASVASSASLASLASSRSSSEDSCDMSITADASMISLPSAPGSGAQGLLRYNSNNSACNLYTKFTIAADSGDSTDRPVRYGCYATGNYRTVRCNSTISIARCGGTSEVRSTAATHSTSGHCAPASAAGCRAARSGGSVSEAVAAVGDGTGDGEWDVGLHLPLWISANERAQIEQRLDGWVDSLLRVGADVEGLAKVLTKPLRPLWINQSSTIWVDQVAQPDQLPFTPLYLISASQPHSYLRQACGAHSGAAATSDADVVSCSDSDGESVRRHSASRRSSRRKSSRHSQSQPHAWTYMYVPGAGDDEESWATGLTPAVFWAHYPKLLKAGPAGIHDAVRKLLQKEALALVQRGANSSVPAAVGSPLTHGAIVVPPPGFGPNVRGGSAGPSAYVARTDEHHLLPAGCRGIAASGAAASGGGGTSCSTGLYFLGPIRIALGTMAAGAAPACWQHVDAVLSCGLQPHPSMATESQQRTQSPHRHHHHHQQEVDLASSRAATAMEGRSGGYIRCGITAAAAGRRQPHSHGAGHTDRTAAAAVAGTRARALPRYLHVPVQHSKHSRASLLQHLGPALSFLSKHLAAGHTVLIHDTNGLDTCVCIAVALLLACFGPLEGGSGGATTTTNSALAWAGPYRTTPGGRGWGVDGPVSKDAVRQRLAYVSAWYPLARPTRGMLRQVYNHFVHATATCGEAGVGDGSDAE